MKLPAGANDYFMGLLAIMWCVFHGFVCLLALAGGEWALALYAFLMAFGSAFVICLAAE